MPSNKSLDDLVLLGDPRLYEHCVPVLPEERGMVNQWVEDLHAVMMQIRDRYGFGRGIAAPQLGIMKRLFYIHIDRPIVVVNPRITFKSEDMFELWDDCMSFPNLLVRVKRHRNIQLNYLDQDWKEQIWDARDDDSELIQHEFDHLDGILCTMRAIDNQSFKWKK